MRIINEEQATQLLGFVNAVTEKLHSKARAEKIAKREAPKWQGMPLLCEYEITNANGRKVKRYLPLVQYGTPIDNS